MAEDTLGAGLKPAARQAGQGAPARSCARCGRPFVPNRPWQKYCGSGCQHAEEARRERERRGPAVPKQRFTVIGAGYESPCWLWTGTLTPKGYAMISTGRNSRARAHRLYYEMAHGQVPPGLQLDHLCRNRACVNPAHLEAVPPAQNQRRRPDAQRMRALAPLIRASDEPGAALAQRLGIDHRRISDVRTGRRWADG